MSDNNWVDEGPREFVRTRNRVQAIRISEDTLNSVAIWSGGKVMFKPSGKNSYIQPAENLDPALLVPSLDGNIHAYFGEWLIKDQDGRFSIMSAKDFREEYQLPTEGLDSSTTATPSN